MSHEKVVLYVTGFGKFGTIERNPTTDIIHYIQAHPQKFPYVEEAVVLETSAGGASETMAQLRHAIWTKHRGTEIKILCIHLGVNANIDHVTIETTAYNCAHFRIPDERGWMADSQVINPKKELNQPQPTDIDVHELITQNLDHHAHIRLSSDPGRFICNYVYFQTLDWIEGLREEGGVVHPSALFIHVPPLEVIPLQDQVEMLTLIFTQLAKRWTKNDIW